MQQGSELIYCCDPDCKEPNKIMNLYEYLESNHNGHKIKRVNLITTELQKIETEPYTRQLDFTKFIDNEVETISKLFSSQLSNKLRSLIEIKKKIPAQEFIQLYQALLDNNQQDIILYQDQLDPLLISNQSQLKQQVLTNQNIQNQLEKVLKFTMDQLSEIDKNKFDLEWENQQKLINSNNIIQAQSLEQRQEKENDTNKEIQSALENEQQKSVSIEAELRLTVNQLKSQMDQKDLQYDQDIKNIESEKDSIKTKYLQLLKKEQKALEQQPQGPLEGGFEWDDINKHPAFFIQRKFAILMDNHTIYKTILIEQGFHVQETRNVQLKIHEGKVGNTYFMIHLLDIRDLLMNCPDFESSYNCNTFSLKSNGTSYNMDGTQEQNEMILNFEDIIDLQWNGPLKLLTITNITTQQKEEIDFQFHKKAQIHFGVSLNNGASAQIL